MIDVEEYIKKQCKKPICDNNFCYYEQNDNKLEIKYCKCSKKIKNYNLYQLANIPLDFWDWEVEDIDDSFPKSILKDLQEFKDNVKECMSNKAQFFFCGKNGRGKTTISILMLKEVLRNDYSGIILKSNQVVDYLYDKNSREKISELRKMKFIVIDELDKLNGRVSVINDFCAEIVNFMDSIPMILISNCNIKELKNLGYPEYFIDRLNSAYSIEFKVDKSYRALTEPIFKQIKNSK